MANWIERTYEGYDLAVARWVYSFDAYTGDARDKAIAAANAMSTDTRDIVIKDPEGRRPVTDASPSMGHYLYRRQQGEHALNFRERARITRYPMHMQAIVAAFVGAISELEEDADRSYGVMGDPDVTGSDAQHFTRNADGEGNNLSAVMTDAAIEFIVGHDVYYGVLPPANAGGLPRFILLDFTSVTNRKPDEGRPEELIVCEEVDLTDSLQEEPRTEKQYIYYTIDGWTRYAITKDGDMQVVDEDVWDPPFVDRDGRPRIPFGRLKLWLRYPVGLRVAEGNIAIYNLISDVRNLIRVANHPMMRGKDMSKEQFNVTEEQRKKGSNMLFGDFEYISPDPGNANVGYNIYKDEVRDYYVTSLQLYNDAPKVMTATQTVEQAKGKTAFLSLLTDAMDELENDVLFLASQIIAPGNPSQWGAAYVERSRAFGGLIIDEEDADSIEQDVEKEDEED